MGKVCIPETLSDSQFFGFCMIEEEIEEPTLAVLLKLKKFGFLALTTFPYLIS